MRYSLFWINPIPPWPASTTIPFNTLSSFTFITPLEYDIRGIKMC